MKIAIILTSCLLTVPSIAIAQDATPTPDRPEFAQERPFAEANPNTNPRRIAKARKKAARIKAARIKKARLKHKRIKNHRIKMARRKASAGR